MQHFLGDSVPIFFDFMLHVATALVALFVFRSDVARILKAFFSGNFRSPDGKMALFIIIASVPIAVVGYTFHDFFTAMFSNIFVVGLALLFTGAVLLASRYGLSGRQLNFTNSVAIGIAQTIAIIPGVSRSGLTVSVGLFAGIDRERLITFSFLLSVPAIIGAALFEVRDAVFIEYNLLPTVIGFVASLVVGYFALNFVIGTIRSNNFHKFSYYCFALGIVVLALSVLGF